MPELRPVDRALAVYAGIAGIALLFPHRPAAWPLLLALHAALPVLVVLGTRRRGPAVDAVPADPRRAAPRVLRALRDWYPLLLLPALYAELDLLNVAVWGGEYFDPLVLRWEQAIFGAQPSVTLAYRLHSLAVSEPLHAAYLSYYALIYVPPLGLYLLGRRRQFHETVFALMLTFIVCYAVFVYFPVQGPRYLFPAPDGELARGPAYRLTHLVLENGSSRGTAFPSSHVAVTTAQTVLAIRYLPRAAPIVGLLTLGLALGAVYGGFHYATDVGAGLALGVLLAWIAPRVRRALA